MCDWEIRHITAIATQDFQSFNPWKGLCVIESRDGLIASGFPAPLSFNPWKGLCVIESR